MRGFVGKSVFRILESWFHYAFQMGLRVRSKTDLPIDIGTDRPIRGGTDILDVQIGSCADGLICRQVRGLTVRRTDGYANRQKNI